MRVVLAMLACSGSSGPPERIEPAPGPVPAEAPAPAPTAAGEAAGDDVIASSAGAIRVHPVQHATFRLEVEGGPTLWVDPVKDADLSGPKADLLLITDIHPDHLDAEAMRAVKKDGMVLVGPRAAVEQLPDDLAPYARTLANGEHTEVGAVRIEAVPMYNLERGPEPGKVFHEKGRGNGYLLDVGDSRIYVGGDTECVPEIKALKDVDVAFVPMNLPYTMPPEEAAACVIAFAPKVVYPYHFRGSDLEVFTGPVEAAGIEVRVRDWYPQQ